MAVIYLTCRTAEGKGWERFVFNSVWFSVRIVYREMVKNCNDSNDKKDFLMFNVW